MTYSHSTREHEQCRRLVTYSAIPICDHAVTYSTDAVGVMLLHVGSHSTVHCAPPALHPPICVMGSGVTGLLAQVVELKGDLIFGVQDPAIAKVTMLCD